MYYYAAVLSQQYVCTFTHIQVYQYAPDEKDLKDFFFGSGFWVNVVFADGTT